MQAPCPSIYFMDDLKQQLPTPDPAPAFNKPLLAIISTSAYCAHMENEAVYPGQQKSAQKPMVFQHNPATPPVTAPAPAADQQQATPTQGECNKLQAPHGVDPSMVAEDIKVISKAGYQAIRFLHYGPFSCIYMVKADSGDEFIAKVESRNEPKKTLGIEARVYQQCLANNMRGIPKLYNCTEVNGNRVMIMQKLGTDLSRIRLVLPNTHFSTVDALKISLETFDRIWNLHLNGWLHRDIKPSNFVIGVSPADEQIYIVDFGLSRPICDRARPTGVCPQVGTSSFQSIGVHNRMEYRTKDDLESWFYMCCLLFNGTLPWIDEPSDRIADFKLWYLNTGRSLLLQQMPQQFNEILDEILRASGNSINYYKIVALLRSAKGQIAQEQFDRPFAWQTDPGIIRRALELGPEK